MAGDGMVNQLYLATISNNRYAIVIFMYDNNLQWDSEMYQNITKLQIPSDDVIKCQMPTNYTRVNNNKYFQIWTPDIVLYNNADGTPQIHILTNVIVSSKGNVTWRPPAIYNSFCEVDVTWFPYDQQHCHMKFGAWSYDGAYVDLKFGNDKKAIVREDKSAVLENGMDLSYYYKSAEWDILNITAVRNEGFYPGCCGKHSYVDITYHFHIRRMTLFHTVNLMLPCILISLLTIFVFYLPSQAGEKMTLCISILITMSVFFLLLVDLMPATSLSIPMIGKYLLLDMILVSVSIASTVLSQNLHYRSDQVEMSRWTKRIFLGTLAWLLNLPGIIEEDNEAVEAEYNTSDSLSTLLAEPTVSSYYRKAVSGKCLDTHTPDLRNIISCDSSNIDSKALLARMIANVRFISDHHRQKQKRRKVTEEWNRLGMVVDRICLIIFSCVTMLVSSIVILQAPSIYDHKAPMEIPEAAKPLH